jgi:hypothetical protein
MYTGGKWTFASPNYLSLDGVSLSRSLRDNHSLTKHCDKVLCFLSFFVMYATSTTSSSPTTSSPSCNLLGNVR